ncbi:hypothetical protein NG791_27605 [Laspinema sp. D1]|uniref:hypothetical protein n=1 Tax=Laspinema palackyanum TaxID=3231601 RepID=UPI00347EDC34|nr:hypothetical protein [Laspinema sp. D2b]
MLIICPGIHEEKLTESFVSTLLPNRVSSGGTPQICILPPCDRPYLPLEILQFLHQSGAIDLNRPASTAPLIWIGFSAGVVGAIGAAWGLYSLQCPIKAFIAIDGWGVPLYAPFPIHRVSHDYFTHWSSALLGPGGESFYADPPVEHLALWRSPQYAVGWSLPASGSILSPQRTTAVEFLRGAIKGG